MSQSRRTQILIGSSRNAEYFFVKSNSWRYNYDDGKLMIVLDEIKMCDRCYWTVCFKLPMATGMMFSITTLTDICCNGSKVCIFPIRASFCCRHNSSNSLVICQGSSKTNFDTNQKTVTVEWQAVKGSRSIVPFISVTSAKQIRIRKTPEINHYKYCRSLSNKRVIGTEDLNFCFRTIKDIAAMLFCRNYEC